MNVTSTSRTTAEVTSTEGVVTVALVEVAGQSLGLLASQVEQVKPAAPVRRLAGVPTLIEGVVDLQGEIVPVLDGRRRLGTAHRDVRFTDRFVILRVHGARMALHVDSAAGVVDVPVRDVQAAAAMRTQTFGCAGIARLRGGLFLVHDTDALLTPHEFVMLQRALAAAGPRSANVGG